VNNGLLFSLVKENWAHATAWLDFAHIMLSEISPPQNVRSQWCKDLQVIKIIQTKQVVVGRWGSWSGSEELAFNSTELQF
jgi:hypothetical protein